MSLFLHPWALWVGGLALGLPILVHWLTRPRPRRLPLSTMRFVREVVHQRRAIHRLRDIIILGLRVLAVAMLAWAFSRPLLGGRNVIDSAESNNAARVILLDVSQSMAAVSNGMQAFERARSVAGDHLSGGSGLQVSIIFAGAQPRRAFEGFSQNLADLRRELAAAQPMPERCDVAKSLLAAADLLSKAPSGKDHRRELIIITDLQRANWEAANFSVLPEDTVIKIESVAPASVPDNLAILRVDVGGRAELGRPIRVEVEVANYSQTPRNVAVDLTLGPAVHRLEGVCPAGASLPLHHELTLQEAGWLAGEARLVDVEDALPADNVRSFVIDVRPRPTFGLITREQADRRPSTSYYLERVLAPQASANSRFGRAGGGADGASGANDVVIRMDPAHVNRETLANVDVLVLARPGTLAPDAVHLITSMLRRGKSVIYVACEDADATNLKLLADAAAPDLRLPVEFMPATNRRATRGLPLGDYRRELPPFRIFGPQVAVAIEPLRFARALDTRVIAGGLMDDVLATYPDKTAALVWSACGSGSFVVLNADLIESNLPQSPAFVPLMGELTGQLLEGRKLPTVRDCGDPLVAYLPADAGLAANLKIRGRELAMDASELGQLIEEPTGVVWNWPQTARPGIYEVVRDATTVMAVATAIPAEEADLRPLLNSQLTAKATGGQTVTVHAATGLQQRDQDDAWTWICVACVAFMLVELVALRLFRT